MLRILHISDLHFIRFGDQENPNFWQRLTERCWARMGVHVAEQSEARQKELETVAIQLSPDVIVATGDLSDEGGIGSLRAARKFLERVAGFERLPISEGEAGIPPVFLTPEGDLRTRPDYWAGRGGIDGFFAARFGQR